MDFKIIKIMEDEGVIVSSYSFNTIYIKDNVWQPLVRKGRCRQGWFGSDKEDLGLYVAEELGR